MNKSGVFISVLFPLLSLNAEAFTNLDFEDGQVPNPDPGTIQILDWSIAAPGWSHSTGDDTSGVYYGAPHAGLSQWFLLGGANSWSSLAGNYSLVFKSGYADSMGEGDWVNAYIAQTGVIPENASSIQLLATGSFEVTIGGASITLSALGNNAYIGDISAYAGLNEELRISNAVAVGQFNPATIDNIEFLSTPLPAGWGLFSSSLGGLLLLRKRFLTI